MYEVAQGVISDVLRAHESVFASLRQIFFNYSFGSSRGGETVFGLTKNGSRGEGEVERHYVADVK
jgi:hypothetical protein